MISSSLNIILLKSRCDRIKIFGYTFAYQTKLLFVDPKRSFITFVSINALCSSISKQVLSITVQILSFQCSIIKWIQVQCVIHAWIILILCIRHYLFALYCFKLKFSQNFLSVDWCFLFLFHSYAFYLDFKRFLAKETKIPTKIVFLFITGRTFCSFRSFLTSVLKFMSSNIPSVHSNLVFICSYSFPGAR